jgi:hypothetical protein
VFVDDAPGAVDALETDGRAHPETDRMAARPGRRLEAVESAAERESVADVEAEGVGLPIDGTVPGIEPCVEFGLIDSCSGKWRSQAVDDGVRRIRRGDSGGILVMMRLLNGFDQRPDVHLVLRNPLFHGCSRHVDLSVA